MKRRGFFGAMAAVCLAPLGALGVGKVKNPQPPQWMLPPPDWWHDVKEITTTRIEHESAWRVAIRYQSIPDKWVCLHYGEIAPFAQWEDAYLDWAERKRIE